MQRQILVYDADLRPVFPLSLMCPVDISSAAPKPASDAAFRPHRLRQSWIIVSQCHWITGCISIKSEGLSTVKMPVSSCTISADFTSSNVTWINLARKAYCIFTTTIYSLKSRQTKTCATLQATLRKIVLYSAPSGWDAQLSVTICFYYRWANKELFWNFRTGRWSDLLIHPCFTFTQL